MLFLCCLVSFLTTVSGQKGVIGKDTGQLIIPLDLSTQRPVFELMIGDKGPYRFIFDTGSTTNVIDVGLASELKLEVVGEDTLRTPGAESVLISNRVTVPMVNFPKTSISEDVVMNTVAIREMVSVDGILCPSFFSKYLLIIDYPGSTLSLSTKGLNRGDKKVIPYVNKSDEINIYVSVGGHQAEAHLDSGNPEGFAIPYSLKDKLSFKGEPVEAGTARTPVGSFKRWQATLKGNIKVGEIVYKDPVISLVENFQFVNLGYQVVKDLRISVDAKKHLIAFERSASQSVAKVVEEDTGEQNEYTGWYGQGVRRILLEEGEMYLQRRGGPKLKLVQLEENLFKMVYSVPVRNELPNVRFQKDAALKVTGLTFLYKDGREDLIKKDI